MGRYDAIDALIHDLEHGCDQETLLWAESTWLAGKLALFLEDDGDGALHATINGFDVGYDRGAGLVVSKAG